MKAGRIPSKTWLALVWVAVALLAAGAAWRFPAGNGAAPGPAAAPLTFAIVLASLGCLLGFRDRKSAVKTEVSPGGWGRTMALVGLMVGYAVVLPWLGFISSSAVLTTAVLRLLGYPHGARAAAFGLIAGFVLHGFFAGLMSVPLPEGWLG